MDPCSWDITWNSVDSLLDFVVFFNGFSGVVTFGISCSSEMVNAILCVINCCMSEIVTIIVSSGGGSSFVIILVLIYHSNVVWKVIYYRRIAFPPNLIYFLFCYSTFLPHLLRNAAKKFELNKKYHVLFCDYLSIMSRFQLIAAQFQYWL